MFGKCFVLGGCTDLDDFKIVLALEYTVTNFGRLQHTVAGVHYKRLTLIFVNNSHPATLAINHLKFNAVIVHIIGHWPAVRNMNM